MKWLLDTNACIRYLNGRSARLRDRLAAASPNDIAVCSIVKAELFFGASMCQRPEETLIRQQQFLEPLHSYPFDDESAANYAKIRSHLKTLGTPIGPNDLMIASIAITNGLTLITHNISEFARVPGLSIEDWESA